MAIAQKQAIWQMGIGICFEESISPSPCINVCDHDLDLICSIHFSLYTNST
jgi:hypothetical protein